MKQLILAAVAATLVFASAAQAAAPATTTTTTTTVVSPMDADACKKAMEACGADQACKDALIKDHSCKAE
ncbi:MAG TPA: hypothetical protein PLV31_05500 [Gammaproteobacteria bacterium]|nr:hypothetical protein [Gammaproteobacteria bacterium]HQZ87185.1 hypothetical protein [Gammaproteobacteria bacterium]HRA43120.1 hypothetical protein [Gammaproteobacteria bacterium]